jgi:hypothetical protein
MTTSYSWFAVAGFPPRTSIAARTISTPNARARFLLKRERFKEDFLSVCIAFAPACGEKSIFDLVPCLGHGMCFLVRTQQILNGVAASLIEKLGAA